MKQQRKQLIRNTVVTALLVVAVVSLISAGYFLKYRKSAISPSLSANDTSLKSVNLGSVRIHYPADWVMEKIGTQRVNFDPPGEGPNPYSSETGEGTNPLDDIYVVLREGSARQDRMGAVEAGGAWDETELIINGKTVLRAVVSGISYHVEYAVILDPSHYLSVTASDDTIPVAEDLIRMMEF